MSISESVEKLLPFCRAVQELALDLDNLRPYEQRLNELQRGIASAEEEFEALSKAIAAATQQVKSARTAAETAEAVSRDRIAEANADFVNIIADRQREADALVEKGRVARERVLEEHKEKVRQAEVKLAKTREAIADAEGEHKRILEAISELKGRLG